MVFIYVLKLTYGKFYIGKTTNPYFRLDNHFNSNGSAWTMKYKPIKVLELIPNCDDYDEDKYTRKYMDKYGFDNVRCGSFVSIELDKITIQYLTRMSNGTKDKCFIYILIILNCQNPPKICFSKRPTVLLIIGFGVGIFGSLEHSKSS